MQGVSFGVILCIFYARIEFDFVYSLQDRIGAARGRDTRDGEPRIRSTVAEEVPQNLLRGDYSPLTHWPPSDTAGLLYEFTALIFVGMLNCIAVRPAALSVNPLPEKTWSTM